jgi:hypothetical protein
MADFRETGCVDATVDEGGSAPPGTILDAAVNVGILIKFDSDAMIAVRNSVFRLMEGMAVARMRDGNVQKRHRCTGTGQRREKLGARR